MPTSKRANPDRLLAFTLDPAIKAELDRQAKAQERSIAAQARLYIRRGLEADARAAEILDRRLAAAKKA